MVQVEADDFQFHIGDPRGDMEGLSVENGLVRFEPADTAAVVVTTGCHWGIVDVAARFEPEPKDAGPEWEDVAEFSVTCGSGLVVSDLEGTEASTVAATGGTYRLRVSACGRTSGSELDYPTMTSLDRHRQPSGERYLIECWQAALAPPTVIRGCESASEAPRPVSESQLVTAGRTAATSLRTYIQSQLHDPSVFAGLPVEVSRVYEVQPARLFRDLARPARLAACGDCDPEPGVDNTFRMYCLVPESHVDHGIFDGLEADVRWMNIIPRRQLDMAMTWREARAWDRQGNRLPATTNNAWTCDLRISLTREQPAEDEQPRRTRVRIVQGGFPAHLADDVAAYWRWQLDRLQDRQI